MAMHAPHHCLPPTIHLQDYLMGSLMMWCGLNCAQKIPPTFSDVLQLVLKALEDGAGVSHSTILQPQVPCTKYSHNRSLHHPPHAPCGCSSLGRSPWQYWAFCHCSLDARWPLALSRAYGSLCGWMGQRPTPAGRRSLCCPGRVSGGDETPSLPHLAPYLLPCASPRTGGTRARRREVCASGCVLGPGCSSWSDGSPRPRCGPRPRSGNCESWTVREQDRDSAIPDTGREHAALFQATDFSRWTFFNPQGRCVLGR